MVLFCYALVLFSSPVMGTARTSNPPEAECILKGKVVNVRKLLETIRGWFQSMKTWEWWLGLGAIAIILTYLLFLHIPRETWGHIVPP